MSFTALRAAFLHVQNLPMSAPARLVILALSNRHNQETGRCDPSVARICSDTQMSERAVRGALRELEKLGVVVTVERQARTGRGKRNLTNRYRLKGGAQYAAGMGHNMPPNLEDNTHDKKEPLPSVFDDLAMSIESGHE